jgi:hypothetical protein
MIETWRTGNPRIRFDRNYRSGSLPDLSTIGSFRQLFQKTHGLFESQWLCTFPKFRGEIEMQNGWSQYPDRSTNESEPVSTGSEQNNLEL